MNINILRKIILVIIFISITIISCDKNHIEHFSASIDYSNKATSIINRGESYKFVDNDSMDKIIDLKRQALKEAKQVDIKILNKRLDGFGNHYNDEFVTGLETIIAGYEMHDQDKFFQGQILLDQWDTWYSNNIDRIKNGK